MTPQHDLGRHDSAFSQREENVRLQSQLFRTLLDCWSLLLRSKKCSSLERDQLLLRVELRLCFLLEMHCASLLSHSELVSVLCRCQQIQRVLQSVPNQDRALNPFDSQIL